MPDCREQICDLRICKGIKATPHKARLTTLYVINLHFFRHSAQKLLVIRQYYCVIFMHSDEKSDCVSAAQSLCGVALRRTLIIGATLSEESFAPITAILLTYQHFTYSVRYFFIMRVTTTASPMRKMKVVKILPSMPNFPPVSHALSETAVVLRSDSSFPVPLTLMP